MSYEIFVNASLILALIAALSVFHTVLKMFTLKIVHSWREIKVVNC